MSNSRPNFRYDYLVRVVNLIHHVLFPKQGLTKLQLNLSDCIDQQAVRKSCMRMPGVDDGPLMWITPPTDRPLTMGNRGLQFDVNE